MKVYFYFASCIALPLFISCSAENETVKKSSNTEWVTINNVNLRKSDVVSPRPKGGLPYGHKVYTFMKEDVGLTEMDVIYRTEFAHKDSLKLDYNNTAKQMGIVFMMHKGLAEKGTAEQKKYYLNEALEMENNLPNLQSFYDLLTSSREIYTKQEIEAIALQFYTKN